MLNKKKYTAILLTCIMILALLTGCGGHSHTDSGLFAIGPGAHLKICSECGEQYDREAHTVVDFLCTVCGCEIFTYEDGSVQQLSIYNENGDQTRCVGYTPEGEEEFCYEYQYGAPGEMTYSWEYYNGVLTAEYEYAKNAEGVSFTAKSVSYNEDGSYSVYKYDEYDNETFEGYYDAAGQAESEFVYENTYDADGNRTLRCTYENGELIEEMEYIFGSDEFGSWSMSGKTTTYHGDGTYTVSDGDFEATWSSEITYDGDGNVLNEIRYEYEYDENGENIGSRSYENGVLTEEMEAIIGADGETTGLLRTIYEEDGSKTVRELNAEFDLVSETVYDAAGNVVSQEEY
ncbi:MAG: hypothetical protein E7224_05140 [Clostridiales bacterium]|nr:hypothetical protein [Clostridiales bacterium]